MSKELSYNQDELRNFIQVNQPKLNRDQSAITNSILY